MRKAWIACAGLAALLHGLFFLMESVFFTHPRVYTRFLLETPEEVELVRVFMLNQGFYNLFLALGVVAGLVLASREGQRAAGRALVHFGCLFMIGAGIVLVASAPKLLRAACIQAGPPLLALVFACLDRAPAPAAE